MAVAGYAIARGAGWASTGWVGAIFAVLGVGLMALSVRKRTAFEPPYTASQGVGIAPEIEAVCR